MQNYVETIKIESAQFRQWAIQSRNPRTGDMHIDALTAAFFRDLDKEYEAFTSLVEQRAYDSYLNWWEHLKDSLPTWMRLRWVDNSLKFGWIQDMQRTYKTTDYLRIEYTPTVTVRHYEVHLASDSHQYGEVIQRASFDPERLLNWRVVDAD